jgi:hypothetical protein
MTDMWAWWWLFGFADVNDKPKECQAALPLLIVASTSSNRHNMCFQEVYFLPSIASDTFSKSNKPSL